MLSWVVWCFDVISGTLYSFLRTWWLRHLYYLQNDISCARNRLELKKIQRTSCTCAKYNTSAPFLPYRLTQKLDLKIFPTIYYMRQTELCVKSYSCSKFSWGIWRLQSNTSVSLLTRPCHFWHVRVTLISLSSYSTFYGYRSTRLCHYWHIRVDLLHDAFCEVGFIILKSYKYSLIY